MHMHKPVCVCVCACVCVELKPRVNSVNLTLISVDELIREIRFEIEDIVVGLDMLPQRKSFKCVVGGWVVGATGGGGASALKQTLLPGLVPVLSG